MNSDVKKVVAKQLKDASKQKGGEEKQNFDKNFNPSMKQKLTVLKVLHCRNVM